MGTTLLPPSEYLVKPDGGRSLVFPSIAQAATAIVQMIPSPVRVSAVTGLRPRELTAGELRELGSHIRTARLRAGRSRQRRAGATQPR